MGDRRWLDLLDAIYDFDAPEPQWLGQLVHTSLRAFTNAEGATAYRYDLSVFADVKRVAGEREIASLPWTVHEEMPLDQVRAAYGSSPNALPVSWSWATPEGPRLPPRYGRALKDLGLADGYAVLAPHGLSGLAIGIGMPKHRLKSAGSAAMPQLNRRWSSIARHLMTAQRLRTAFANGTTLEEVSHRSLAPGLAEHARQVERAREATANEGAGLEVWAGLLSGRWSLVRAQHHRGRSRYLAIVNEHPADRRLTPSEVEVVERARRGEAAKAIAIDLHLEETTVSMALATAMRKLGLRSREELVRLSGALAHN